ncbi:MAG: hypothetical protein COB56_06660 [Robiginitomaculum sp.]|nr:MAG: hypothetical protein COB56_06660 [Robiginitomaculum sp.]
MILRSLTKHVKDQNWFAVGLDFFIVVFGVFIGLQVSNWNEARQSQNLAENYIERLQTDIGLEQALWGKATDYFGTARDYGNIALDGFSAPLESLDEQFLIALYQASQVWYVAPNRATFDELQSTGRIVNIRDEKLRTILSNHYLRGGQTSFTLNQTSQYRRIARLYMHQTVQAQIRENCGDKWVTDVNNFYYVLLPKACEIDIAEEALKAEIARLHSNVEVQQELRFHLSVLGAQLGVIGNATDTATATLEKLNEVQQ